MKRIIPKTPGAGRSILALWVLLAVAVLPAVLWFAPAAAGVQAEGDVRWQQVPGVIHVQTRFDGSGAHSLAELVDMARRKGLGVIIPADHDLQEMAYGLWPLRNLIRKKATRPSVLANGPEAFLERIDRVNRAQSDVVVLPAVQSSPFYYWTGSPFAPGGLTAHNYRKELLLVGMDRAADYTGLPVMHGPLSTRYLTARLPLALAFLGTLLLSAALALKRGRRRRWGIAGVVVSLALLVNHHPFQSSRFDAYHGDAGVQPYQEVIDYVGQRGGLTFWLHPESNYAVKGVRLGPVRFTTPHHPEDLVSTTGYTGFEALYGDTITATEPGRQWDRVLTAYCRGERSAPAWGIAGADFRRLRESGGHVPLDYMQTVFLVRRRTAADFLEALRSGRFYAVRKPDRRSRLVLQQFEAAAEDGRAGMGETLNAPVEPEISGTVDTADGRRAAVTVTLIRDGAVFRRLEGRTPVAFRFPDTGGSGAMRYYRLMVVEGRGGRLLSNPIFVKKLKGES